MRPVVAAFFALATAGAGAAADPAPIDTAQLAVAVGGSAFADGTLRGLPASVAVGTRIPGRALWWHATIAYGPTTVDPGDGMVTDGRGGEIRTGPRVLRCGTRGYVCGAASAELGAGFASGDGRRHHDLVVDTRVHLVIGFDRAATIGLDLDLGVRGRVPITGDTSASGGATPGVVAGVSLFVRR
ncbi:MAG TPA: hypothetical protein VM734_16100 [Kofleriaceae bacterium]|nr:hypothetical protein [Kofleriaceae bacterium]